MAPTKTARRAKSNKIAPTILPLGPLEQYPNEYMTRPIKIVNPQTVARIF